MEKKGTIFFHKSRITLGNISKLDVCDGKYSNINAIKIYQRHYTTFKQKYVFLYDTIYQFVWNTYIIFCNIK